MMKPSALPLRSVFCLGLLLLGLTHEASAQAVYRIVGPDGKVTYSDRPPQDAKSTVTPAKQGKSADSPSASGNTNTAQFPAALQQAVGKYPATLYTTKECSPCDAGRAFLVQRGIPFTEKTVNTKEDFNAFKRISTDNSMPHLTLGGQQIKGYSESEWGSYLDAADYPKQSMLPRGYQQATAQPLVPLKTATNAPSVANDNADTRPNTPSPTPAPTSNTNTNPAGIKF